VGADGALFVEDWLDREARLDDLDCRNVDRLR
jgi:hypothetical protein